VADPSRWAGSAGACHLRETHTFISRVDPASGGARRRGLLGRVALSGAPGTLASPTTLIPSSSASRPAHPDGGGVDMHNAPGTSLGGQTVHEKQPGKHRTHGDQAGGGPRRECAATHRVSRRCCTGPVRPMVLTRAPYPGDRRERGKGCPARRISFRIRHTFDSDHMKLASVSWPRPPRATAANVMRDAVTTTILWTTFTPIHTPLGYLGRWLS
jgi:hypothetical protein